MKALLLAAGFGRRLRPLTNNTPKCLLKINGVPLIDIWLRNLKYFGVEQILINTHYLAEKVNNYIKKSNHKDIVKIVYEPIILGTAGTLFKNKDFFNNEDFLLIHADNLCFFDYNKFLNAHNQRPEHCVLTMMTFLTNQPKNCGVVEIDKNNVVTNFFEKVANPPTNIANAAIYVISPELFNKYDISKCFDFSNDVITQCYSDIQTWQNDEGLIDIGTFANLKKAQILYKKRQFIEIKRHIKLLLGDTILRHITSNIFKLIISIISHFTLLNQRFKEIKESTIIKYKLKYNNTDKFIFVYDCFVSPPTFGDFFVCLMFVKYFLTKKQKVDFIIIKGMYRDDWKFLNDNEKQYQINNYCSLKSLILNSELITLKVMDWFEFTEYKNIFNHTSEHIFFVDEVFKRKRIYNFATNTLFLLAVNSSESFLDEFLLDSNLFPKTQYNIPKKHYISWDCRYNEKWGLERTLSENEFKNIYDRLRKRFSNSNIVIVSNEIGCEHYRKIANKYNYDIVFSKDLLKIKFGEIALILNSQFFYALKGTGKVLVPIFSKNKYEIVDYITHNEKIWSGDCYAPWSDEEQSFRLVTNNENDLPK